MSAIDNYLENWETENLGYREWVSVHKPTGHKITAETKSELMHLIAEYEATRDAD